MWPCFIRLADEMKELAERVTKSIREKMDESYVRVLSEIRKTLKEKRDKRKQAEKIMAVVDPMRNAKRKLRIAEKHRAHKKRKITMKFRRWT